MTLLGLWLVLALLSLANRLHAENFVGPTEEFLGVEYYDYEGDRISIYRQAVKWDDASALCFARNGTLVEFDKSGVAEFVARALAESAVEFGALWIGGYLDGATKDTAGVWKWAESHDEIQSTFDKAAEYPMTEAPYWVGPPDTMLESGRRCLGTDRRYHHLPLIVSVDCEQKRPYICRLPPSTGDGSGVAVKPPLNLGSKSIHIFHGLFTWAQARSQCLLLGMRLAKLTNDLEFTAVGNRMRRTRPILENAWIGGQFIDGEWKWVDNDPVNVNVTTNTTDLRFAWYRPDDIIMEGCLLADRHVCEHFVYVEAKCDRRRSYICEKDLDNGPPQDPLLSVNGTGLWVSTYEESWHKAQNACQICLDGALLEVKVTGDGAQLPDIYGAMALTIGTEIRHVWVGGYLFGNDFKFVDSDGKEKAGGGELTDGTADPIVTGDLGILLYCKINVETDSALLMYKCLNMDRENQKNFFMYGLQCDLKQHFICDAKATELNAGCKAAGVPLRTEGGKSGGSVSGSGAAPTTTAAPEEEPPAEEEER